MPDRVRIWAARLGAPLAFFGAATILLLVINTSLNSAEPQTEATTVAVPTVPAAGTATEGGTTTQPRRRRFYRVRSGDTLESIANRFDTTTEELLRLNPDIDPLALRPGQRLRIG